MGRPRCVSRLTFATLRSLLTPTYALSTGFRQCWREILRGGPDPHLRHDAWDLTPRLNARTDLYNGAGACSAFRMFQGVFLSTVDCCEWG